MMAQSQASKTSDN